MTALGEVSPKAENSQDSRKKRNVAKLVRRLAPGAIKRLFSAAKTLLTPQPKPSRKRSGETRGGFVAFAHKLTRKVVARTVFHDPAFWVKQVDVSEDARRIQEWHENNVDLEGLDKMEYFAYAEQTTQSLNL
jgi:hypothetical protein